MKYTISINALALVMFIAFTNLSLYAMNVSVPVIHSSALSVPTQASIINTGNITHAAQVAPPRAMSVEHAKNGLMMLGIQRGDHNLIRYALELNEDINARNKEDKNALHLAVQNGNIKIVQLLLAQGAHVNAKSNFDWWTLYGDTVLHEAATQGYTDVAQQLLLHGADVNSQDGKGRTPLHIACYRGDVVLVDLFLKENADVTMYYDSRGWWWRYGTTALHEAAQQGHDTIVTMLLDHEAAINAQDASGRTSLHLAVIHGHEKAVEVLLGRGANMHIKDANSKSALAYAKSSPELTALLARYSTVEFVHNKGSFLFLGAAAQSDLSDNEYNTQSQKEYSRESVTIPKTEASDNKKSKNPYAKKIAHKKSSNDNNHRLARSKEWWFHPLGELNRIDELQGGTGETSAVFVPGFFKVLAVLSDFPKVNIIDVVKGRWSVGAFPRDTIKNPIGIDISWNSGFVAVSSKAYTEFSILRGDELLNRKIFNGTRGYCANYSPFSPNGKFAALPDHALSSSGLFYVYRIDRHHTGVTPIQTVYTKDLSPSIILFAPDNTFAIAIFSNPYHKNGTSIITTYPVSSEGHFDTEKSSSIQMKANIGGAATISPNGKLLAVSAFYYGKDHIMFFILDGQKLGVPFGYESDHFCEIRFSGTGSLLAIASEKLNPLPSFAIKIYSVYPNNAIKLVQTISESKIINNDILNAMTIAFDYGDNDASPSLNALVGNLIPQAFNHSHAYSPFVAFSVDDSN